MKVREVHWWETRYVKAANNSCLYWTGSISSYRLSRDVQVLGHVSQNSSQCADPERLVTGNRDMVLASLIGSQAHVAASLACYFVAIAPKQDGQFLTTEVAW